jgi:hypothetical protein
MLILLTDKGKVVPVHTGKAYEKVEAKLCSFLTLALHGGGGMLSFTPRPLYPQDESLVPMK